jgi:hypothetical protein
VGTPYTSDVFKKLGYLVTASARFVVLLCPKSLTNFLGQISTSNYKLER